MGRDLYGLEKEYFLPFYMVLLGATHNFIPSLTSPPIVKTIQFTDRQYSTVVK